uniref:Uncharacterized protein n=1 Tax=Kalanchoe fedtschenkoi TaxID=63787 RepID=A0A7N0VHT5_KALFE
MRIIPSASHQLRTIHGRVPPSPFLNHLRWRKRHLHLLGIHRHWRQTTHRGRSCYQMPAVGVGTAQSASKMDPHSRSPAAGPGI